jgi:hypothetical protein
MRRAPTSANGHEPLPLSGANASLAEEAPPPEKSKQPRRRPPFTLDDARRVLDADDYNSFIAAIPLYRQYSREMAQRRVALKRSGTMPQSAPANWDAAVKGNATYVRLARKIKRRLQQESAEAANGTLPSSAQRPPKPGSGDGGRRRSVRRADAQRLLTPDEYARYERLRQYYNMYMGEKRAQLRARADAKGSSSSSSDSGSSGTEGTWKPPANWAAIVRGFSEFQKLGYKAAVALERERRGEAPAAGTVAPRGTSAGWDAGGRLGDVPKKTKGAAAAYVSLERARRVLGDADMARLEEARRTRPRYLSELRTKKAAEAAGAVWAPPSDWQAVKDERAADARLSRVANQRLAEMEAAARRGGAPGVFPWATRLRSLAKAAAEQEKRTGSSWLDKHRGLRAVSGDTHFGVLERTNLPPWALVFPSTI